jgi:lipid-binding SYLF domain-containing protein
LFILFMTPDALSRFEASNGWTAGADARVTTQTAQQPVIGFVLTNGGLMGSLRLNGNRVTPLEIK